MGISTFRIIIVLTVFGSCFTNAQELDEFGPIRATLYDYIEGTANGEPDRLTRAFHPDFKLFTVIEGDSLLVRSGSDYIKLFTAGKRTDRKGRILTIDVERNVAIAKVAITLSDDRRFIDYLLLVKYAGQWKIVQKSYTRSASD